MRLNNSGLPQASLGHNKEVFLVRGRQRNGRRLERGRRFRVGVAQDLSKQAANSFERHPAWKVGAEHGFGRRKLKSASRLHALAVG